MTIKFFSILAISILLIGCSTEESSHAQKIYIDSVSIDLSKNTKTILIYRVFYVGENGPDGWVGWQKYAYRLIAPLGRFSS